MADRAEWDNYYIENWSLWLDFKIMLMTLAAVVRSGEARVTSAPVAAQRAKTIRGSQADGRS